MKPAPFSCQAKPSAFSPPHLSAPFFPPHRARFSASLRTCGKGPLESVWSFPSSEPLSESVSAGPGLSAFEFLPPASQLVGSSCSPQVQSGDKGRYVYLCHGLGTRAGTFICAMAPRVVVEVRGVLRRRVDHGIKQNLHILTLTEVNLCVSV